MLRAPMLRICTQLTRYLLGVIPVVVLACSSGTHDHDETVGVATAEIINGQNDVTHAAVVSLYLKKGDQASRCSGTIVKTDPASGIGWVLTAAHCVAKAPVYAYLGEDYMAPATVRFTVLDDVADTRYTSTSSGYDFAVVRILGVDAKTPVIPILSGSQDTLQPGTPVVSVGFGATTSSGSTTTQRHQIARTLNSVTSRLVGYSLATGGMCFGDSGGPVLVDIGGTEYVAAVHSYVTGNCTHQGYSARVTSAQTWIRAALGAPTPERTCELCAGIESSGTHECALKRKACTNDLACAAYRSCLGECETPACAAACRSQHPLGVGPYQAILSCTCNGNCATLCRPEATCANVPRCGRAVAVAGDACGGCMESSCCDDVARCADDGVCHDCFGPQPAGAACEVSSLHEAVRSCAQSRCAEACGLVAPAPPAQVAPAPAAPEPEVAVDAAAAAPDATSGCAVGPGSVRPRGDAPTAVVIASIALGLLRSRRRRRDRLSGCPGT